MIVLKFIALWLLAGAIFADGAIHDEDYPDGITIFLFWLWPFAILANLWIMLMTTHQYFFEKRNPGSKGIEGEESEPKA